VISRDSLPQLTFSQFEDAMLDWPPPAVTKTDSRVEVTALLRAWSEGDPTAQDQLWPIVYDELNRLARQQLRRERVNHTLQTGALVNEAYVRLVDWKRARWKNRAHFFGMCARIMRQILVDCARTRGYQRRGGDYVMESLDESQVAAPFKSEQVIALDEALQHLAAILPRTREVVELRFFGGLTVEETAEVLRVSRLTVIRDWNFARAWLLTEMSGATKQKST
jgi:RNA polymerase sigma factor (TIGR02999 family)